MYQFPMGKVKWLSLWGVRHSCVVSIPYGKGKGKIWPESGQSPLVSIPYGKGKVLLGKYNLEELKVSIPYGKGKEKNKYL